MTTRSLTVLVVPAATPDDIDALGWDARRERGGGWTRIELLHPGAPDVLLRLALDLDQGVYGSARAWDDEDGAVVETSTIMAGDVEDAASLLAPHLADPVALATLLIGEAGSNEDPQRVARAMAEQPSEPAAGPAEEAATYVRVFQRHVPEALQQAMGIAWELRTPAPCACAVWDGTTLGDQRARGLPRSQFVTLASEESRGALRGRLRCARCRATFVFASYETHTDVTREPRRDTIELGPDEIDRVIAGIRDGAQVDIGGSRCHTTYRGRDGELVVEDFDEGHTEERPCSEDELRRTIAGNPGEFLEVLRRPLREVLQRALVGVSQESPHEALHDLLVYGECLARRHLLEAVISWPDVVTAEAQAELASLHDGLDVYHFIRQAVGYDESTPATGRFGLRVFVVLAEMLGRELPRWRRYRSDFRAMAGDADGALADLEWERKHLPAGDSDRPYLERAIAKLVDARLLAQIAAAPEDDAPRLVWADVLTERGDPRGELIVAQCRLATLDEDDAERAALLARTMHLVALHGRAWGKRGYAYHRGFVDSIEVRWTAAAADLDEAFALSPPVQGLRFRTYRDEYLEDPARALDDPRLERIAELDCTMPVFALQRPPEGEVRYPFGSQIVRRIEGHLPMLRELKIRGVPLSVEDVMRIGPRPGLRTLDLGEVPLRGALTALLGDGGFDGLRVLRLDHCDLGDDDLAALTTLPALDELDLRDNPIGDRGARTLAGLGVRRLHVGGTAIGDEGAAALAAAAGLVMLDVSRSRVGSAGVAKIADLALACLLLDECSFDAKAVRALADGRAGQTLRRLSMSPVGEPLLGDQIVRSFGMPRLWQLLVRGCAIDGDAAVTLLESLPSLRALGLGRCTIGDAGLEKIVAHPAFARLDTLELGHDMLGPDAGAILARAPRLPQRLFLNGNRLGDAGARALAEAPAAGRIADLILLDNAITQEGALALVGESSQLVATVGKLCLHDNAIGSEAARVCTEKLGPRFCF